MTYTDSRFPSRRFLKEELSKLISDFTCRDFEGLSDTDDLLPYAGLESIGLVSLICLIEDRYGITSPEQNLFEIRSLSDLTDAVLTALNSRQ